MLNITDILKLKEYILEKDGAVLHMHDTCGGMYFTIDNLTENTKDIISCYLNEKKATFKFSDDGKSFTIL